MHPGLDRTYWALAELYYWPQLYQDVAEYVRTCDKCQRTKASRTAADAPLQPLQLSARNWDAVSLDFIVALPKTRRGHDAILVVVDRLSKMAHFIATTTSVTTTQTAQLVFQHVVKHHGLPRTIVSDRDPRFTSSVWRSLWKLMDTQLYMSTASHDRTDGQTERINQVLEDMLRAECNHNQDDWDQLLPCAEFAYNSRKNASTTYSPFYTNYGFHPTTLAAAQCHRRPRCK